MIIPPPQTHCCQMRLFPVFGSFLHIHRSLWLILLYSHVLWSTEVFGSRSAEWLFISSCFHDIICLCLVFRLQALPLEPGCEITQRSTEIFKNEIRAPDPHLDRFWTAFCPTADIFCSNLNYLMACYILYTIKCTRFSGFLIRTESWTSVSVYLHFPSPRAAILICWLPVRS